MVEEDGQESAGRRRGVQLATGLEILCCFILTVSKRGSLTRLPLRSLIASFFALEPIITVLEFRGEF